jgi:hypothetical protein
MTFQFDPEELHQFPDRLFRRELQNPANLLGTSPPPTRRTPRIGRSSFGIST